MHPHVPSPEHRYTVPPCPGFQPHKTHARKELGHHPNHYCPPPSKPFNPRHPRILLIFFAFCLVSQRKTNMGECDWESVAISRTVREFPPPRQFQLMRFIAPGGREVADGSVASSLNNSGPSEAPVLPLPASKLAWTEGAYKHIY